MPLLDLPPEIFAQIIDEVKREEEFPAMISHRLVCREFSVLDVVTALS